MGQALRLALAGIRARAGSSVAVLLLLVVALSAAVVGPVFLRAADESAVRRAVRDGPVTGRQLRVESTDTAVAPHQVISDAQRLLGTEPALLRVLRRAVAGGESITASGQGDVLPVAWRDDLCGHLVLRSGRCPRVGGEVVMADPLPPAEQWRVGGRTSVAPGGTVTVVGTYAPLDPQDPYWFGHGYEPADVVGDVRNPKRRLGAAFTVAATLPLFVAAGNHERDLLDVPVDPGRVTARNADAVAAAVAGWTARVVLAEPDARLTTQLPDSLAVARHERAGLRLPVLLVVGQLLLLCLLVLRLVVEGTSSARAPEIALARLRGLGPWRVVAFGLLEVVLLVLTALAPALAVGVLAARVAGAGRLSPGTPVVLTGGGVLCGVAAVVVAVLVAGWAGREALRTPASELLRTTAPVRRRAGSGAVSAVVVLAIAGALELGLGGGGLRSDRLDVVALAAPGALALAVALVGARLLPLGCRLLVPVTRMGGPVSVFLAVRQLARRPAGGRNVVVVASAFGLAAFAVYASSVQAQNTHDRALADNGADRVYTVQPDLGVDLQRVVRAADPGGHAMAALTYDSPDSSPGERRLLAVDSSRLAAVAFWRDDLTSAAGTRSIARLARSLAPPVGPPVLLRGDAVRLIFDARDVTPPLPPTPPGQGQPAPTPDPPRLSLELDGASGLRQQIDLGPIDAGGPALRTVTVPVVGCAVEPCRLRALRVTRQLAAAPVQVAVVVQDLAVRRGAVWTDASAALAHPERWRTEQGRDTAPTTAAGGLAVTLTGDEGQQPALTVADHASLPAAVVTATAFRPQGQLQVPGLDAHDQPATQLALAGFLPGAGPDAALMDLTAADRAAGGTRSELVTAAVWASPKAPADLVARLAAGGVRVTGSSTAAARAAGLARQGPALAVRLLLLAGGTATVLAPAGAALSLALLGRRRRYELAALQAAGLGSGSLSVSVLAEQVALLTTGAVLGLAAGLAGGALAIRSVPQFDDVDAGLPLLTAPRPAVVALVLGAAVLVVLAVALLSGLVLLRGRGVERLREAQA